MKTYRVYYKTTTKKSYHKNLEVVEAEKALAAKIIIQKKHPGCIVTAIVLVIKYQ